MGPHDERLSIYFNYRRKVHTSKIINCLRPHILWKGGLSKGLIFISKTPLHSSMPFPVDKETGLICEVLPSRVGHFHFFTPVLFLGFFAIITNHVEISLQISPYYLF